MPALPWVRVAAAAAIALALFLSGWLVRGWRADAALAELRATQAAALQQLAQANNDAAQKAVDRQQKLETAAAQVDSLQGELSHVQADNARLRAAVSAGTQRVLIRANCPASGSQLPATTGTPSVGHEGTVELAPATGQDILDIRAGILADQGALTALQQYVRTVCRPAGSP
jgi:prophage endopeptidase